MSTITTRAGKGSPLTNTEVDSNFTNLNTDKYESGSAATLSALTLNPADGGDTRSVTSHFPLSTVYNPAADGSENKVVSGHRYNWYSSYWQLGASRSGGTDVSDFVISANGAAHVLLGTGGTAVFNTQGGATGDFAVKSDNYSNALYVDASEDRVGIKTSTPSASLHVTSNNLGVNVGDISRLHRASFTAGTNINQLDIVGLRQSATYSDWTTSAVRLQQMVDSTYMGYLQFGGVGLNYAMSIGVGGDNTGYSSASEAVRFASSGAVFNENSADMDFRVESNNYNNALVVDAGNDRVELNSFYKFGDLYGTPAYQTDLALATSAESWILLGNFTSPGKVRFNYRSGSGNSEEHGWIEVHGTYVSPDIRWHKNTYNYHVAEVRAYHSTGGAPWQIWVRVKHGTGFVGGVYFRWQLVDGWNSSFSVSNTTGTPGGYNRQIIDEQSGYRTMSTDTVQTEDLVVYKPTTSVPQIKLSNSTLGNNYGGAIQGYGVSGSGGYLELGVIDSGTYNLALQTTAQAGYTRLFASTGTNGSTSERLMVSNAAVVVNDVSADVDFRVESDSGSHALFVDAGNAAVVVNYNAPDTDHNSTYSEFTVVSKVGNGAVHAPFFAGRSVTGYQDGIVMGSVDNQAYITATNFGNYGNTSAAHTDLVLRTQASATRGDLREGIRIHSTGSVTINDGSGDQDFRVESDANTHAIFVDASSGYVCFNTSSNRPDVSATLAEGISFNGGKSYQYSTSDFGVWASNTDGVKFYFRNSTNDTIGSISYATSLTGVTYSTTSDRRLKENIKTISDGTAKLMAMRPVTHTWIAQPDAPAVHGFIAQEMLEIVPEAVSGAPDGEEMMSMDYGRITPVLVAALQDAHKKIAELEARLNTLEGK